VALGALLAIDSSTRLLCSGIAPSLPQDCSVGKVLFLARFNEWASDCTIVTLKALVTS
jgi:hypothetical protein